MPCVPGGIGILISLTVGGHGRGSHPPVGTLAIPVPIMRRYRAPVTGMPWSAMFVTNGRRPSEAPAPFHEIPSGPDGLPSGVGNGLVAQPGLAPSKFTRLPNGSSTSPRVAGVPYPPNGELSSFQHGAPDAKTE